MIAFAVGIFCASGCAHTDAVEKSVASNWILTPSTVFNPNPDLARRILALDPERLTEEDVTEVLSKAPAPRIYGYNGSVTIVTLDPFMEFLIGMGYPKESLTDPRTGRHSLSSYANAGLMADRIIGAYEETQLRPMLIGHSQGGAMVLRILHELSRRKADLKISFASAIATGKMMRFLLGQWHTMATLRDVPDSVQSFSGYHVANDIIGSDIPFIAQSGDYKALGTANVRNIRLSGEYSHLRVPVLAHLAQNEETKRWVQEYVRTSEELPVAPKFASDSENIVFAADIWYDIKKNWCLELQRWIREHQPEIVQP